MNKWTYAATLAACLAYLLVRQQDGAGLVLFDHEIREQLPVSTSRVQLHHMMDLIERTEPSAETDTKVLFEYLAERLPRRSMVVILSDLLTDPQAIARGLQRFRFGGHEVLVLHVLDHDELEFPFTDRTLFEGIEQSDLEVLTDPQSLRQAYLERLDAFVSRLRGQCLDHQIEYALISTADPLDTALVRFLAGRMHRTRSRA